MHHAPVILGRNAQNVLTVTRTPEPGFRWSWHLDRLAWADELDSDDVEYALEKADWELPGDIAQTLGGATARAAGAPRRRT